MPKAQRAYQPPTLICTTHTSQQNQVLATALMATKTQQPQSMNRCEVMVLQSCRLHGVMWMPPLSPISTTFTLSWQVVGFLFLTFLYNRRK